MGMFDYIKYEMDCPKCGSRIKDFQSKGGLCILEELDFQDVDNFYSFCGKCDTRVEFNFKEEIKKTRTIEDYDLSLS